MGQIFEIYKTTITEAHKNFIKNHFMHKHEKWPIYKEMFFRDHPTSTDVDFYSWMTHHMCENWEEDIIWMDDEKFKYHWPSQYSFIREIHFEEA
jgi:hypothetical protein